MKKQEFRTIDEYIKMFPHHIQVMLEEMRFLVKEAAPEAEEGISYQMPVFKLYGNLVYFGAHKDYIGFYPTSSGIHAFKNELTAYKYSKGAIRFPFDMQVPQELVKKIVKFRVAENREKHLNHKKEFVNSSLSGSR